MRQSERGKCPEASMMSIIIEHWRVVDDFCIVLHSRLAVTLSTLSENFFFTLNTSMTQLWTTRALQIFNLHRIHCLRCAEKHNHFHSMHAKSRRWASTRHSSSIRAHGKVWTLIKTTRRLGIANWRLIKFLLATPTRVASASHLFSLPRSQSFNFSLKISIPDTFSFSLPFFNATNRPVSCFIKIFYFCNNS